MNYPDIIKDARVESLLIVGDHWELRLKHGLCFRDGTTIAYFKRLSEAEIRLNGAKTKK